MITRTQLNKVFDTLPPPGQIKTDVLLVPAVGVVGVDSGVRTPFEAIQFEQIKFHKKRWASRPGRVGHDRWVFQGEVCDDEKGDAMTDTNLGQELSDIIEKQKSEERNEAIFGEELFRVIAKHAQLPDPGSCRRVIIDMKAGEPVILHVEQYGTKDLLKVDWSAAKGLTVSAPKAVDVPRKNPDDSPIGGDPCVGSGMDGSMDLDVDVQRKRTSGDQQVTSPPSPDSTTIGGDPRVGSRMSPMDEVYYGPGGRPDA